MVTRSEIAKMSYSELHRLSLEKDSKGRYTFEADMAYSERRRRSNEQRYPGERGCDKYRADFDYYGEYKGE